MRWAVIGSRGYSDLDAVRAFVQELPAGSVVISGGARGVDTTAELAACAAGLAVESWRPERHPRDGRWAVNFSQFPAGSRWAIPEWCPERFPSFAKAAWWRNAKIVEAADAVRAFWDGASHGTAGTMEIARAARKLAEGSFVPEPGGAKLPYDEPLPLRLQERITTTIQDDRRHG